MKSMNNLCVDIQAKYWKKCEENKQLKKQVEFLTQIISTLQLQPRSNKPSRKRKPLRQDVYVPIKHIKVEPCDNKKEKEESTRDRFGCCTEPGTDSEIEII